MYLDADYFSTQLAEDVKALKDGPPTVEIQLTDGVRYNLYQVVSARSGAVTIQVYPLDGALRKYSKEDQEGGMPPYYAEMLVVPYATIQRIRLHLDDKKQQTVVGFGGSAK